MEKNPLEMKSGGNCNFMSTMNNKRKNLFARENLENE